MSDSDENAKQQQELHQPDDALQMNGEDKQQQPAAIKDATRLPKIGNVIQYKAKDEDLWQRANILSSAGKATEYASWFNNEDIA